MSWELWEIEQGNKARESMQNVKLLMDLCNNIATYGKNDKSCWEYGKWFQGVGARLNAPHNAAKTHKY